MEMSDYLAMADLLYDEFLMATGKTPQRYVAGSGAFFVLGSPKALHGTPVVLAYNPLYHEPGDLVAEWETKPVLHAATKSISAVVYRLGATLLQPA